MSDMVNSAVYGLKGESVAFSKATIGIYLTSAFTGNLSVVMVSDVPLGGLTQSNLATYQVTLTAPTAGTTLPLRVCHIDGLVDEWVALFDTPNVTATNTNALPA